MKRIFAVLMAVLLLMTGCSGEKQTPPTPAPPAPEPPVQESVGESELLTEFRNKILSDGTQIAVGYLGYADLTDYEDLTVYLESSGFYEMYPLLTEMEQDQFVQREGGELYLVVPASGDISLTQAQGGVYNEETVSELFAGTEYDAVPDRLRQRRE